MAEVVSKAEEENDMTVMNKLMPLILEERDRALRKAVVSEEIRECLSIDILRAEREVTAQFIYKRQAREIRFMDITCHLSSGREDIWPPYNMGKLYEFFVDRIYFILEENRRLAKTRAENDKLFSRVKPVLQFLTVIAIAVGVYLALG